MSRIAPTTGPDRGATQRGLPTWARGLLVVGLLYLFLAGVKALELGIRGIGEGFTDALFASASNPLAG
ncbi:MAG: hypothetical protein FJW79_12655, partial [Actinobacteria bacterium]|nr:hypothetical protein [Actinomycetota bacterium]